jgi:hypothetical protein
VPLSSFNCPFSTRSSQPLQLLPLPLPSALTNSHAYATAASEQE